MPAGNPPTRDQRLASRERPGGFPVMRQRWAELLFLHWPIDPAVIQARLPDGLFADTFDGSAWLGVVPFSMEKVHPVLLPPLPLLSWFLELNVRTYVHDAQGNPGVWFFSLDCNQPVAVEIARRGFHLPYEHAAMQRVKNGRHIDYSSRRKAPGETLARFSYETPATTRPAAEGSLDWFLVERYILFSAGKNGRIYQGRVHHPSYQIAAGRCDTWSTTPLRLTGFDEPTGPPASILVADAVDVNIFPLRPC
jgi:uncharacterized protein YqjF (DUF2071 family)